MPIARGRKINDLAPSRALLECFARAQLASAPAFGHEWRMRPRIRPATADDHPAFVRLFPELAVEDPIVDREGFARDLVPTTLVAEDAAGQAVGYLYYTPLKDVTYVRHLVTAPEARRQGVGRALLEAVRARCTTAEWCLNVKPGNVAAIALYESLGLTQRFPSRALTLRWDVVERAPVDAREAASVVGRSILLEDDARVTTAMHLLDGQLETARAAGRVLVLLEAPGEIMGAAIFDPSFPGAYPFRVARPGLAIVLVRALATHKREGDEAINLVCEDQPDVADALESLGATVRMRSIHMRGRV